jgi:hypothetical protein
LPLPRLRFIDSLFISGCNLSSTNISKMVSNSDEIVFEVVKGMQLDLLSKKSREKYEIEYDLIKKIMTEKMPRK